MIHLVPMGQAPGDLLDGINLRDVAEQPWLDHRTTLMAGKRHQVYLMVVAVGRALAIEQHGLVWRRLHEGYVLQMHFEDHGWLPLSLDRHVRRFQDTVFHTPEEWRQIRMDRSTGAILFDGDPTPRASPSPMGAGSLQTGGSSTPGGESGPLSQPRGRGLGGEGGSDRESGRSRDTTPTERGRGQRGGGRGGGSGLESDQSSDSIPDGRDRKSRRLTRERGRGPVGGYGRGAGAGAGLVAGQGGGGGGAFGAGAGQGAGPGPGSAAGAGGGPPFLSHQVWGESQQRGSQGGARGGGASAHQSEEALWGSLPPEWKALIEAGKQAGGGGGALARQG